jgi:hypothetical protein
MREKAYEGTSNEAEGADWKAFKADKTNFFGDGKAENYESLVDNSSASVRSRDAKCHWKLVFWTRTLTSCALLVMSTANVSVQKRRGGETPG